jgi:hypothetical protein
VSGRIFKGPIPAMATPLGEDGIEKMLFIHLVNLLNTVVDLDVLDSAWISSETRRGIYSTISRRRSLS